MVVALQLVESEVVADNCQSRCKEQGILFYRFNLQLEEVIATGETDSAKLMDMIIEARKQVAYQKDFSVSAPQPGRCKQESTWEPKCGRAKKKIFKTITCGCIVAGRPLL